MDDIVLLGFFVCFLFFIYRLMLDFQGFFRIFVQVSEYCSDTWTFVQVSEYRPHKVTKPVFEVDLLFANKSKYCMNVRCQKFTAISTHCWENDSF